MLFVAAALAGPLAIPAAPEPSFTPPAPLPAPASLAAYRERAVSVRRYTTLQRSGGTAVGFGMGWPGFGAPGFGFSTSHFIHDPVYEVEHWAVYQGNRRLSVPEWMDLADAPVQRDVLRRKLRTTRAWHTVFIGTAIAGGIGAVATAYGSQSASTYDERAEWRWAQAGSTAAVVGGIVGAFSTGLHQRTLRYDFTRTQELAETSELVRAHNEALRDELGLSEPQTRAIDAGR